MGRFASNDFTHSRKRDDWEFEYTAQVLLPFAVAKYEEYKTAELNARKKLSADMANPDVRLGSDDQKQLEKTIISSGEYREKCSVWVHEFKRDPLWIYKLDLSDVTFFNIAPYEIHELAPRTEIKEPFFSHAVGIDSSIGTTQALDEEDG